MKKILAIALAVVLGLASLSSLALIDRGDDTSDTVMYDALQISTSYAVAITAAPVGSIGDPGGAYNADKVIYGAVRLSLDQNRTGAGSGRMEFKITSEDVLFPAYMNSGTTIVHYTDKNGLVRVPNYMNITLGTGVVIPMDDLKATSETDTTKNQVKIVAPVGNWLRVIADVPAQRVVFADLNGEKATTTGMNDEATTTIYLGFSGLVKDGGTKTEGKITGNMTLSAGTFSNGPKVVVPADFIPATAPLGTTTVDSIDVYADGKQVYRILKVGYSRPGTGFGGATVLPGMTAGATEYLVHPVWTTGTNGKASSYANYAIGFVNNGNSFGKLTYRTTFPQYYMAVVGTPNQEQMANFGATPYAWAPTDATDFATVALNAYGDVRTQGNPSLKVFYEPVMNYFGFSFAYTAALKDGDFTGKAGLTSSKEATFAYFGTPVTEPDDDVDVPQTGDASASILIVLGASAILAAAALAFVMKKARD